MHATDIVGRSEALCFAGEFRIIYLAMIHSRVMAETKYK